MQLPIISDIKADTSAWLQRSGVIRPHPSSFPTPVTHPVAQCPPFPHGRTHPTQCHPHGVRQAQSHLVTWILLLPSWNALPFLTWPTFQAPHVLWHLIDFPSGSPLWITSFPTRLLKLPGHPLPSSHLIHPAVQVLS